MDGPAAPRQSPGRHSVPGLAFPKLLLQVRWSAFPSPDRASLGASANLVSAFPHWWQRGSLTPAPTEHLLCCLRPGAGKWWQGHCSAVVPLFFFFVVHLWDTAAGTACPHSRDKKGLPSTAVPCQQEGKLGVNPNPVGREDCASVPHTRSLVV